MKLTAKSLKQLILEVMEDDKEGDFVFSVDPSDYINKDQDVEVMHQFISLILDSDAINYVAEKRRNGYSYEFGFADEDSPDPDPESYQAFLALSKALKKIGVPTLDDLFNNRQMGQGKTYMSISDYPNYNYKGALFNLGDIHIKQQSENEVMI
jgi:hypothetical protein